MKLVLPLTAIGQFVAEREMVSQLILQSVLVLTVVWLLVMFQLLCFTS